MPWLWATGFALVGALLNWFGDPWFRAVVATAVLPCVAFITLTGFALFTDLQGAVRNQARQTALRAAGKTLGAAGVPLVIVLLTLLFGLWLLKLLL